MRNAQAELAQFAEAMPFDVVVHDYDPPRTVTLRAVDGRVIVDGEATEDEAAKGLSWMLMGSGHVGKRSR